MRLQTLAALLGLAFASAAQAQACKDGFKSSGNFLSGSRYSTQAPLPGVTAAQAFEKALRFTADNGFTVQSSDAAAGQIRAAQSAQLVKGKQVPLEITLRDEAGGAVIAISYATGPGQLSPEAANKEHFCKTVAAAADPTPVAAVAPVAAPMPAPAAPRPAVVAAAPAAPVIADSEFIRKNQPCMSGLCLGDTNAQLPKSLRWELQNPALAGHKPGPFPQKRMASDGYVELVAKAVQGPRASVEKVATGLQVGAFNGEELQALAELQAVCGRLPAKVTAYFKSASGHPTMVHFAPHGLDEAGRLQFRVSQMFRQYPAAISVDQKNEMMAAAEQQYRPLIEAHRALKIGQRSDLATVHVQHGPAVHLLESIWIGDRQDQLLLKHPACGGAAAIKLE